MMAFQTQDTEIKLVNFDFAFHWGSEVMDDYICGLYSSVVLWLPISHNPLDTKLRSTL